MNSFSREKSGHLTGAVHLLDFSEETSKGLAVWLPSEWVPNKPHLTPRGRIATKLAYDHLGFDFPEDEELREKL